MYTRVGLTMEEMEAPLKKLASYSMILDGMPLPSCFADGLSWLVGQLPSRGYQEVADSLKKYLDDYSGRVSALAIKDMLHEHGCQAPLTGCNGMVVWLQAVCARYIFASGCGGHCICSAAIPKCAGRWCVSIVQETS